MGIALAAAQLLVDERKARPFSGSALLFGRQDLAFRLPDLARWAEGRGAGLSTIEGRGDGALFRALGFTEVRALDASGFEGAEIIHDLNQPIPEALRGSADLVFNGGTLEHVFDIATALRNVHDMLRVGGRAIHIAPVSNHIDHGFYSFSPTMLYDWATTNEWTIHTAYVFQMRDWESPWTVYEYVPGAFDAIASRFHDVRVSGITLAGLWFCLEKTPASTGDRTPQQGAYLRAWAARDSTTDMSAVSSEEAKTKSALRDWKRKLDRATPLFNERPMPKKLGRYG
jgi:SAM-dependent methyltransferase